MNQPVAEVLILVNALGAGILMFVARVVQRIMNDLDEIEFKQFMNRLDRAAMGEPFAVTVATLPIIAAVYYWVAYGFGHWLFTAGLVAWMLGSAVTKVLSMPVYESLADATKTDPAELRSQRRKLQAANNLRAWITLGSVLLMASQFSVEGVLLSVVASALIAVPLLLLARRSMPGTATSRTWSTLVGARRPQPGR